MGLPRSLSPWAAGCRLLSHPDFHVPLRFTAVARRLVPTRGRESAAKASSVQAAGPRTGPWIQPRGLSCRASWTGSWASSAARGRAGGRRGARDRRLPRGEPAWATLRPQAGCDLGQGWDSSVSLMSGLDLELSAAELGPVSRWPGPSSWLCPLVPAATLVPQGPRLSGRLLACSCPSSRWAWGLGEMAAPGWPSRRSVPDHLRGRRPLQTRSEHTPLFSAASSSICQNLTDVIKTRGFVSEALSYLKMK